VPPETDANEGKIDRARVLEVITAQLAEILEVDPAGINESDSFSEDLHLGSLELIELVEAIEEEFARIDDGFRVEDDDLENLRSVRDAVDYVISRL
jgi:acyl carrier protein